MKATLFSVLALVGASLVPGAAEAQNCVVHFAAGLARISGSVAKATTQPAADAEVDTTFGPRPQQCEAGAYASFLERFEDFGRTAIRAGQPRKGPKGVVIPGSDNQMRLAISVFRKTSPIRVPLADSKAGVSLFKQLRSNLNAVADDAGNTPMMGLFLDSISAVGSPGPIEETVAVGQTPNTGTTGSVAHTGSTPPGGVQQIRVPMVPLPSWAVIKLYEARDLCKPQDVAGIQVRLQDVINWMESNGQLQP
jgi:hypothetical protein